MAKKKTAESRSAAELSSGANSCEYYCSGGTVWNRTKDNSSSSYYCPLTYGAYGCPAGSYTTISAFPNPRLPKLKAVPRHKGEYTLVGAQLYLNRTNTDSKHYCPPTLTLRQVEVIDKKVSTLIKALRLSKLVSSATVFVNAIRVSD
jgi:hypothetical protein